MPMVVIFLRRAARFALKLAIGSSPVLEGVADVESVAEPGDASLPPKSKAGESASGGEKTGISIEEGAAGVAVDGVEAKT